MTNSEQRRAQWRQYRAAHLERKRAQGRAAQAIYREKHYYEIRLAERLKISMKEARKLFRQQQKEEN